jgi:hypothetical protein
MKAHPNFNTEGKSFRESSGGKTYLQKLKEFDSRLNQPILSNHHKYVNGKMEKVAAPICDLPKKDGKCHCHLNLMNADENPYDDIHTNPNFVDGIIRENEKTLEVRILLDNGAYDGACYISKVVENFLKTSGISIPSGV